MPKKDSKSIIASGKLQDELLALKLGVERSDQAIFITDKEGVILYINPAFEKIYGFKPNETIGKTPRILKSGKESQKLYMEFWDTLLRKEIINLELVNKTKDGRFLNIKVSANPIINGDNEILGFLSIQSDITEKIEIQKKLIEAEKNYRDIVDNSLDMIHSVDKDGYIVFANKKEYEILGYKPGELVGKHIYDIYSKDLTETVKNGFKKLKEDGRLYVPEGKMVRKDGKEIDVEIDSITIKDDKGSFIRTRSIIRDVTEHKKQREELLASEERYHAFFEQAMDAIVIVDAKTAKLVDFNEMAYKNLGYSHDEFAKLAISDLEAVESESGVRDHIKDMIKKGSDKFETKHKTKKGELRDILVSIRIICLAGKNYIYSIFHDVTEQRNAHAKLLKEQEKYKIIFESSRDAIMTLEPPDWKFTSGNPATIKMFSCDDEKDFASRAPWQFSPQKQPDGQPSELKAKEMILKAMETGSNYFEWTHRRKNGEDFPATVLLTRMTVGDKTFLQATVRDITEHKLADQELKSKIEQMEFMGRVNLKRYKKMLQMQKEIIDLKKRLGEDVSSVEGVDEFMT